MPVPKFLITVLLCSLLLSASAALGQVFQEDWTVAQAYGEWGHANFDVTGDGFPELTKIYGNRFEFFSATGVGDTTGYSLVWSLQDTNYTNLTPLDLVEADGTPGAEILVGATYGPDTNNAATCSFSLYDTGTFAQLAVADVYAATPSNIELADPDNDGVLEVIMGLYWYDTTTTTWKSQVVWLTAATLALEWYGVVYDGIIIGPDVGDIDHDGLPEILFTLYDPVALTSTYTSISYISGVTAVGETPPPVNLLGYNVPNPFNPTTLIPLHLPTSSSGELAIYDPRGQRVRVLLTGKLPTGNSNITWDGRDDQGQAVASGVYFAKLKTAGQTATRKMVLVR